MDSCGPGHKSVVDLNRVCKAAGQRLENKIVSVSWAFNWSCHVVKYLSKVITALLSLWDIVSGCKGIQTNSDSF